jgi:hypothetical protein
MTIITSRFPLPLRHGDHPFLRRRLYPSGLARLRVERPPGPRDPPGGWSAPTSTVSCGRSAPLCQSRSVSWSLAGRAIPQPLPADACPPVARRRTIRNQPSSGHLPANPRLQAPLPGRGRRGQVRTDVPRRRSGAGLAVACVSARNA